MLRYNIHNDKGLVNGAMGTIIEIIWPSYRRGQLYAEDIPSVKINFDRIEIHKIDPKTVQFPALYSKGTVERRMLPLILCWSSTVHKLQGTTLEKEVANLGNRLFAPGQAYVALSRVKTLDGLKIEELDCSKLLGKKVCNEKSLAEMERLRKLPDYRLADPMQ